MAPHGAQNTQDLETLSEVDEKIIPAIAELEDPLVMSSRLKKLMARREAAKGSWEPKQKKAVEEENVPLPSEKTEALRSSLLQQVQTALLRRWRRRRNRG